MLLVGSVTNALCDDEGNDGAVTTVLVDGKGVTNVLVEGEGITNVRCDDQDCVVDAESSDVAGDIVMGSA